MTNAAERQSHLQIVPDGAPPEAAPPLRLSAHDRPCMALWRLLRSLGGERGVVTLARGELAKLLGCNAKTVQRWTFELKFTGRLKVKQHPGEATTYIALAAPLTPDITRDITQDIAAEAMTGVIDLTEAAPDSMSRVGEIMPAHTDLSSSSSSSSSPTEDIPATTEQASEHPGEGGPPAEPPSDRVALGERMLKAGFDIDDRVIDALLLMSPDQQAMAFHVGTLQNRKKFAEDGRRLPPIYLLKIAFTEDSLEPFAPADAAVDTDHAAAPQGAAPEPASEPLVAEGERTEVVEPSPATAPTAAVPGRARTSGAGRKRAGKRLRPGDAGWAELRDEVLRSVGIAPLSEGGRR